jgi:hypothetical protein
VVNLGYLGKPGKVSILGRISTIGVDWKFRQLTAEAQRAQSFARKYNPLCGFFASVAVFAVKISY